MPFNHLLGYPFGYPCGCPCRITRATDSRLGWFTCVCLPCIEIGVQIELIFEKKTLKELRFRAARYSFVAFLPGVDLSDPNALECPEDATGFFPFPPDCRKYLNCWRGRGTIQPCAPATFFDPVRRECDYPEKVKCTSDCYAPGR